MLTLLMQNLKLQRQFNVRGRELCMKRFRYNSTGSSEPSLKLILPEKKKKPYIITVEPEDGMVTHHTHSVDVIQLSTPMCRLELLTFGGRVSMNTCTVDS